MYLLPEDTIDVKNSTFDAASVYLYVGDYNNDVSTYEQANNNQFDMNSIVFKNYYNQTGLVVINDGSTNWFPDLSMQNIEVFD